MDLANKLFKGDRVIWIIFMMLCIFSIIEVFSATSTIAYRSANHWSPIIRHATFLFGGFMIVLVMHNIPYKYFVTLNILMPIALLLLILTPLIGVTANDAHRWIEIGGIQFQPSEIAKLGCIIYIATILSRNDLFSPKQKFWWITIGVSIPCLFIFKDNISTALLLFGVCFVLMFIGQVPIKSLLCLLLGGILAGVLAIALLKVIPEEYIPEGRLTTAKARIDRYFNSEHSDFDQNGNYVINDDNYQVAHANIAIARGGIVGRFPGHGEQRDFLPQAYSDFIYAIIMEELGYIGGLIVMFLYIVLMVRVGIIAKKCKSPFAKFLVLGSGLLIVIQALANMAVAVNLIPVTGQPLPLISRGGTSNLITCVYIGIILSVSRFGANIGNEDDAVVVEEASITDNNAAIAVEEADDASENTTDKNKTD